ncbi:TPA: hypothetical protein ACPSKY_003218 [Legionella bozemanae]|uniref:hypothetical protein n=1 Tax=Legionella bozemanae TaxID=447 RepID=UPI00216B0A01|nr:hypothetical protein [Legionella bozemanae]
MALITNSRMTSLSKEKIQNLPDNKNFSVFNNNGQLILSSCHGKVIEHQPLQWPIAGILNYGFLARPSTVENNNFPELERSSYTCNQGL